MEQHFCRSCGAPNQAASAYCTACGAQLPAAPVAAVPPTAAPPAGAAPSSPRRPVMSRRTKGAYTAAGLAAFSLFLMIFVRHLPGGENPVIALQPQVSVAATQSAEPVKAMAVEATVRDGKISFPLEELRRNRMVAFSYQARTTTVPLLALISPEGKIVTAVRLCEPCNSSEFIIEGNELACAKCETRWSLSNFEGLQGSCQKFPPAPIPSRVSGGRVEIDESIVANWKLRM